MTEKNKSGCKDSKDVVGIDLGTTNCAVSHVEEQPDGSRRIALLKVPQMSAPGEVMALPVLPSFLYLPGEFEISADNIVLPWPNDRDRIVGVFAREQGSRVPGRLVSSAKSWLCHSKVDRASAILPWAADKGVVKVSPVTASSLYLAHIRSAWNHRAGEEADGYLENQNVIITVPASFDEVARDFTLQAARMAGLPDVTLLEEPLAAFYSWLVFHENDWDRYVKPNELILVCDVGGGTSDFTLITLREVDGHPRFERIAVGDHLILGGDNMDLALARLAESRFGRSGGTLSANRWQALTHQCRAAKEDLLAGKAEERAVTIMGEGGKLIGGTLSSRLNREELTRIIVDGFFPLISPGTAPTAAQKAGITEFGLPYAQDPAVTRHMGTFLLRHRQDVKNMLGKDMPCPDLILFNGGALKPPAIQQRIREAVAHFFSRDTLPRVLENPDLDLAVSRGAAYYGLVKSGRGVRVGSGSPRGYYLKVGTAEAQGPEKALCLVERGVEEGVSRELSDKEFSVAVNQPVSFSLYSSSFRSGDKSGDIIEIDDTLTELPPLNTVIRYGKKAGQVSIPVHLIAEYTETGALALWCRSGASDHRWRLSFQLRNVEARQKPAEGEVLDESAVAEVLSLVASVFIASAPAVAPEKLSNAVADLVRLARDLWPLSLIRRMADELLQHADARRMSPDHESRWENLLGFCLRPGFGDALDEHRIRILWALYKKGPAHDRNPQVRLEWWVLWRRAAGGLSAGQQRQLIQDLTPLLKPKKAGSAQKIAPQELNELWMLVGNLERLMTKDKADFGRHLLSGLNEKKARPQQWQALGRLGARELLYGPLDRVIPAEEAAEWIARIMEKTWANPRPAAAAAAQIARKTGDRKRDLPADLLEKTARWLSSFDFGKPFAKMVLEKTAVTRDEEAERFGDSLPAGITLHGPAENGGNE
ncbi:MAG: Hsp70 family protein [Thermodesulfobacteriota bacterium]